MEKLAKVKGNIKKIPSLIWAVLIGVFSFLIIYGVMPLNPLNDAWIMAGYDEIDIIQHYSGWLAFRNSPWQFPVGMASHMAVGDGTLISYTDSIPWAAIFFKLFSGILPETFQYFGIFILVCFILQSIAAYKVIFYKTESKMYSLLGSVLFSFAPILMERSFRHTGLAAQWLILFSILLYIKHKDVPQWKNYVYFLILEVLAIGIHPYFLPMVFAFAALIVIEDLKLKKVWSVFILIGQAVLTYGAGYVIGVLGHGAGVSRDGYGHYSMNLNALINPTSLGEYRWSALLPVRPQTLGNYDGFNYLGIGILLLFVVVMLASVVKNRSRLVKTITQNVFLCVVLLCLTLFAVSNVVTWDERIVLEVPLPSMILQLCGIFRASSRLFYPVYYCLIFFLLLQLWRLKETLKLKGIYVLLMLCVLVQLWDLHYVIKEKHLAMEVNATYESVLQNEEMKEIAKGKKYLLADVSDGYGRKMAVWAFKNNLQTFFSVANTQTGSMCGKLREEKLQEIYANDNLGDTIILTIDLSRAEQYGAISGAQIYPFEGAYLVY